MWKAVFASVGAAVGPFIGGFVGHFLAPPTGTPSRPPVYWLGMPPVWWFVVPIGGALFCLLGFWLGSVLDRRSEHDSSPKKWKALFAALGAAVGPVIGFYAVSVFCVWNIRQSGHGNEFTGLAAMGIGIIFGVPIGGALFCLLGLWLGSALDRPSRLYDSPQE